MKTLQEKALAGLDLLGKLISKIFTPVGWVLWLAGKPLDLIHAIFGTTYRIIMVVGRFIGWLQGLFVDFIMMFVPGANIEVKRKRFHWGVIIDEYKRSDFVVSIITMAVVVSLAIVISKESFLKYSVMSGTSAVINRIMSEILGEQLRLEAALNLLIAFLMIIWRDNIASTFKLGVEADTFVQKLPMYAWREELIFRAGAEKWSLGQRISSCLSFGLIHFSMIFIPLGLALTMSIVGAVLMAVYLHEYKITGSEDEATKRAAVVHSVYNSVVFTVAFTTIVMLVVVTFFPNVF